MVLTHDKNATQHYDSNCNTSHKWHPAYCYDRHYAESRHYAKCPYSECSYAEVKWSCLKLTFVQNDICSK